MPKKRPSNKRPKYFPNNWKAYKESPDEFFLPISYKDFFNWKVMGWALPSSIACVIREENEYGDISEKVYSQSAAAQKYLAAKTADKNMVATTTSVLPIRIANSLPMILEIMPSNIPKKTIKEG